MIRKIAHIILVFVSLKAECQILVSQKLRKFSIEQGLSSYNVRKIISDSNGALWVATQFGLNYFDGTNFKIFSNNSEPPYQLLGSDVRDLYFDYSTNSLWALASEGGVSRIDINSLEITKSIEIIDRNNDDFNLKLFVYDNVIWIGSFNGLRAFSAETGVEYELRNQLPNDNERLEVSSFLVNKDGTLSVFYLNYGVEMFDCRERRLLKSWKYSSAITDFLVGSFRVNDAVALSDSTFLIATSHGLQEIKLGNEGSIFITKKRVSLENTFISEEIYDIELGEDSTVYLATVSALFNLNVEFTKWSKLVYAFDDGIDWYKSVHSICAINGSLLAIGNQQGVAILETGGRKFKDYFRDLNGKFKLEHVRGVEAIDNQNLIIGLANGLVKVNTATNEFEVVDSLDAHFHIFRDPFKRIIVSDNSGMYVLVNRTKYSIGVIYEELRYVETNPTNSHLLLNDSLMVLGTENERGIIFWDFKHHKSWVVSTKNGGLKSDIVNNLYLDSKKRIWILSDKVITILNIQSGEKIELFENLIVSKKQAILFFDMCEADGYYWITSYGIGVIKIDDQYNVREILSSKNGLSDDGTYDIIFYDPHLFVTSNRGLSVIDTKSHFIRRYFESDGLHSSSFEEVASCVYNNKIFAGGLRGFTEIDPNQFGFDPRTPKIFIQRVISRASDGNSDLSKMNLSRVEFSSLVFQVDLHFSVIDLVNPVSTEILYRLENSNESWTSLGKERILVLAGLAPGTYLLEYRGVSRDGLSSEIKQLTLIFLPKWYQTWWFKVLIGLIVLGIIYGLYRLRIDQLKKEEAIRNQLASDLHDDLGSTLNSVKVYANLAMMDKDNNSYLIKIKESTQEAIVGVRDLIWVLDDKKDSVDDLVNRVQQFAGPYCEANGVKLVVELAPDSGRYTLGKEEKRSLYLIMKEFVNNSIKYAQCTQININIAVSSGRLAILINDNGTGFEMEKVKEGNGLRNFKSRAKEIHYSLEMNSKPGEGTTLSLKKS